MALLAPVKRFNHNPRIARVRCDNPTCGRVFFRPHRDRKWGKDYCDRVCSGVGRRGKRIRIIKALP